ncbi:hypothetical protein GC090_20110 (plasmid) [Pantoea sp. JZ29]|uniref:hypothetical protein n=1 Tax=Pantoea sp. JZ29 TaxID=2654192 RepID=UPI002B46FECC|nr:hypothetical protein [Pantoea sp. JZ29]WRH22975.1 hypothetical protein GC090_20110 [Pantoea sp. JZ29]
METLKAYNLGDWAIIIGLIVFVAQTIFKAIVEQSLKKKHEINSKAVLVADLLAEWVSHPQDKRKLRQLTNEAFLWLPSKLATELSKVLADRDDALDYRQLMTLLRKHLLGNKDDFETYRFIVYPLTEHEKAEIEKKKNDAAEYMASIKDGDGAKK